MQSTLPFAQTNLQLYNQLVDAGFPAQELARVRRAYELATGLFSGVHRPCGKTLIAHLVGTASLLARSGEGATVVVTGLLHAAYVHGDFGDGRRGVTDAKRATIRRHAGDDAEERIAGYHSLRWNDASLRDVEARGDSCSPIERDVLVVRLANELEDQLDLAMLYRAPGYYHAFYAGDGAPRTVALARRLGCALLADSLEDAFRATAVGSRPQSLVRDERRNRRIVSPSYRRRWAPVLRELVQRARRVLQTLWVWAGRPGQKPSE